MNEKQVTTWVAVQQDGVVLFGHCSCMAGLGEVCSHVGAVLFDTLAAVNKAKGTTCTDASCYWSGPSIAATRKVDCCQGSDIQFTKKQRTENSADGSTSQLPTSTPSTSKLPPPTEEECKKLYEALASIESKEKCAVLSMVPGHAQRYKPRTATIDLPKPLHHLYHTPALKWPREQLMPYCDKRYKEISVTLDQVSAACIGCAFLVSH